MTSTVPASTSVRRSRVQHVDTGRLLRRQDHLLVLLVVHGSRSLPNRSRMVARSAELSAVRGELEARGAQSAAESAELLRAARLMAARHDG